MRRLNVNIYFCSYYQKSLLLISAAIIRRHYEFITLLQTPLYCPVLNVNKHSYIFQRSIFWKQISLLYYITGYLLACTVHIDKNLLHNIASTILYGMFQYAVHDG